MNAIQALYQLSYTPSSGSRRLLRVKSSGNLPSLTPPVNHLFSGASELVSARVSGWAGAICRLPAVVDCRRVPGTLLWKRASTGRVSATWADWWWNGRGWRHRALCAARRSCRVAADRDGSPYPAVRCTVSLCRSLRTGWFGTGTSQNITIFADFSAFAAKKMALTLLHSSAIQLSCVANGSLPLASHPPPCTFASASPRGLSLLPSTKFSTKLATKWRLSPFPCRLWRQGGGS